MLAAALHVPALRSRSNGQRTLAQRAAPARDARLVGSRACRHAPQRLVVAASAVTENFHTTKTGLKLQVLSSKAGKAGAVPLVFVHGSYHAAWCWAEHFLPYFSERGYDCYALSLRGQGASDLAPGTSAGGVAGTLQDHAADVADFLRSLPSPAVLAGHSFGGLVVQEVLTRPPPGGAPRLAGLALLASVPPQGNSPMVARFLRTKPIASLKVTYSFISKAFEKDEGICRETFFSKDMPSASVRKYMDLLSKSSKARLLDLRRMAASVPLPAPPKDSPPVFVMGGADDFVVDEEGLRESAVAYGTTAVVLKGLAHDVMIDTRWEEAARALEGWLREKITGGGGVAGSTAAAR